MIKFLSVEDLREIIEEYNDTDRLLDLESDTSSEEDDRVGEGNSQEESIRVWPWEGVERWEKNNMEIKGR